MDAHFLRISGLSFAKKKNLNIGLKCCTNMQFVIVYQGLVVVYGHTVVQ